MKTTIVRLFEKDGAIGEGTDDDVTGSVAPDPLKDWEAWLGTIDEPVAKAFEQHTTNLRSALQKERENASTFKPFKKKAEEAEGLVTTLREELNTAKKQVEEAGQLAEAHKTRLDALLLETAVVKAASILRFQDPGDAFALLTPDEKAILKVENDAVVGAEEVVTKLLSRKPYLVLKADQGSGLGNANNRSQGKKDKADTPAATTKTRL